MCTGQKRTTLPRLKSSQLSDIKLLTMFLRWASFSTKILHFNEILNLTRSISLKACCSDSLCVYFRPAPVWKSWWTCWLCQHLTWQVPVTCIHIVGSCLKTPTGNRGSEVLKKTKQNKLQFVERGCKWTRLVKISFLLVQKWIFVCTCSVSQRSLTAYLILI